MKNVISKNDKNDHSKFYGSPSYFQKINDPNITEHLLNFVHKMLTSRGLNF